MPDTVLQQVAMRLDACAKALEACAAALRALEVMPTILPSAVSHIDAGPSMAAAPSGTGRRPPQSPWLSRREVAALLGVAVSTLAHWAKHGSGPPYYKLNAGAKGHVRYSQAELEAWVEQRKRLHTADDGSAARILREAKRLARKME